MPLRGGNAPEPGRESGAGGGERPRFPLFGSRNLDILFSMKREISRRTLLRGIGGALALPWLEAMSPTASAATAAPPVRLAFFYIPNGVHLPDWRPSAAGPLVELPPSLKALDPVKRRILVLSDLAAEQCHNSVAGHEPVGGFLVGSKCRHSEDP